MTQEQSKATRRTRWVWGTLVMAVIVIIFLLPYLWMVASSFKSQTDIFADVTPLSWRTFLPINATLENFAILFGERGIGRALANSFIIALIQVGGAMVTCTLAAYALTRIPFRGRGVVFALILVTFMLPTEALVVPLYSVASSLSLEDTLLVVALPWVANVFGLFLLRQHFEEIPIALDEAARLDGAGHARIFWSVILPNVKTAIATLGLIVFLFSWNAFLWPLVIIQSPENQPIQVAIAQSVAPGELPNWGLNFAGAVVATIPLIILFLFLQRYFVKGLATSGLK
ncbi:carbohydrate ABC transporter permease [Microbacterium esteraromaticum]|uniref:carbohydrate ABC transporter permease n=1 Tax=Microbacterium esteraromaticum TaxID=57043 RepID=UPI001C97CE0D|nr:carbohydrate ABC transporter permease [Microbacterium esteraromaticum]MBY6062218.1 carbohydrate ABC transporter permease [Microbacterium esteraromaticum]